MHSDHARGLLEVAASDPQVTLSLTAHETFVIQRTVSLRLASVSEELARVIKRDRYTVSGEQQQLLVDVRDLYEVLAQF